MSPAHQTYYPRRPRQPRIVLAGANSQTGRLLSLLLRDSGVHTTALVRRREALVADDIIDDWTGANQMRARDAMAGADAVVLLTGVLGAGSWQHYQQGMIAPAAQVAAAVGQRDIRVVYFSSLLADAGAENWYCRAKGLAEDMLAPLPQAVIFRLGPVVRGSPRPLPFEQALLQAAPDLPVQLFAAASRTSSPINLGDVATIAEAAALGAGHAGCFELGGPEQYDLAQLACLANGNRVAWREPAGLAVGAHAGDLAATLAAPRDPASSSATAAAFGLRLTPLSLAWPLDAQ